MHDKHRTIGGSQGFGTGTQRTSPSRKLSHDDVLQHNNVDEVPPIPVRRGVRHITAVSPSSDSRLLTLLYYHDAMFLYIIMCSCDIKAITKYVTAKSS